MEHFGLLDGVSGLKVPVEGFNMVKNLHFDDSDLRVKFLTNSKQKNFFKNEWKSSTPRKTNRSPENQWLVQMYFLLN